MADAVYSSRSDLAGFKVEGLRSVCRALGLSTRGLRAELEDRLMDYKSHKLSNMLENIESVVEMTSYDVEPTEFRKGVVNRASSTAIDGDDRANNLLPPQFFSSNVGGSSIHDNADMQLTLPVTNNVIKVGQAPKEINSSSSEWLVSRPKPVQSNHVNVENDCWLVRTDNQNLANNNRSIHESAANDRSLWLCKPSACSPVQLSRHDNLHVQSNSGRSPTPSHVSYNHYVQSQPVHVSTHEKTIHPPGNQMPVHDNVTPSNTSGHQIPGGSYRDSMYDMTRALEHRELVEAIKAPAIKPPVFSGELIDYPRWKKAFCAFLKQRVNPSASDKLYYLEQYTSGQVNEVIQTYLYLDTEQAFQDAMHDLDRLYGNSFLVAQAFKTKLSSWNKIANNDAIGIFRLTNFLKQCRTAMNDICDLQCLNLCEKNQEIVSILPDFMARSWNSKTTEYQLKHGNCFPPFSVFVEFMELESAKANNPVTSSNALKQVSSRSRPQTTPIANNQPKPRANGSGATKVGITHQTTAENSKPKPDKPCAYCSASDHNYVAKCPKFKGLSVDERWSAVKERKLCWRCLGVNHRQTICTKEWKCSKCQKLTHHSLLHRDAAPADPPSNSNSNSTSHALVNTMYNDSQTNLFAPTVPVWVSCEEDPDKEILTYALIDAQSNRTFITNDVASQLKASSSPGTLTLSTMTSAMQDVQCGLYSTLRVRGFYSSAYYNLPLTFGRNQIPCCMNDVPNSESIRKLPHLDTIRDYIAPKLNCGAGLLLGRDCSRAITIKQSLEPPDGAAQAVEYALGWTVVGPSQNAKLSPKAHLFSDQIGVSHLTYAVTSDNPAIKPQTSICFNTHVKDVTPRELMKQIDGIEFETTVSDTCLSQDDMRFIDILDKGTYQDEDNYYVMPLPFREEGKQLQCNYEPVLQRFHGLLAQFRRRGHEYKAKYREFMNGFLSRGEAEPLPADDVEKGEGIWYLPHHGVTHKKTGKLRCVFDCSCVYNGLSLNDTLLQGPDLNNPLQGVLMRFREKPVAVSCDLEKMFCKFHVPSGDRNFLRFFWLDDDDNIKIYRMCSHIFGARSSPNCAKYGLNRLAQEYGAEYPLAQKFIQRDFYVDDGLTAVNSVQEAIDLLNQTRMICSNGNLRVHKLLSNRIEVLEAFPREDINTSQNQDVILLDTERALGMLWSLGNDSFKYTYTPSNKVATRRTVLANVASVYDPLGLIAPLMLSGRSMIQKTCKSGLDWDEPLDEVSANVCKLWDVEMSQISSLHIPRCLYPFDFQPVRKEIHTFADASESGYGACTYARSFDAHGQIHCTLLLGKSRISPVKHVTIPRLELQASLLAAKQSKTVLREMGWDCDAYLWSDSQIVLGYIQNDSRRFHTFVANRLREIHELSNISQWHYVRTDRNPADIASRGVKSVQDLNKSDWFHGPDFLWSHSNIGDLAAAKLEPHVDPTDPEVRRCATVLAAASAELTCMEQTAVNIVDRSSSWVKTQRNMAAVLKILNTHKIKGSGRLTIDDMDKSKQVIVKAIQKKHFSREIQLLTSGQAIDKTSSLWRLDCFLDEHMVLRVGGRLKNSTSMTQSEKHPIILPTKSNLSTQLVRHYHQSVAHQGRTTTMSAVRSAGFWIVGLSSLVSSIIYQCVLCRRLRRPTEIQKMADLPADRVETTPPFTNVGCDVFGPFPVKEGRKTLKRYGLLFTCMSSRAVHIEVLDDLSTDCFLQSWRCFVALRGDVKLLRCDNGTNFVGANNEITKLFSEMNHSDKLTKFLLNHQCKFVFNTPQASHMGGCWERMVKSVRAVFAGLTAHMHNISTSNLRTIMYECMAIINSRPLTTISEECKPLSPNDLLHMKSSVVLPMPGHYSDSDIYARKRWRAVQYLVDQFWHRWKKEYVQQLQARQKWTRSRRNLQVNDIVILYDETNRLIWKLGRVAEVFPSSDGYVRSVRVSTTDESGNHKEYSRPVSKLVCLVESTTCS